MPRRSLSDARFYAILDLGYVNLGNAVEMANQLAEARVDVVQLRAKNLPAGEFLNLAQEISPLFRAAGIPFLLNDHPELVQAAGADGAHVGQDDLSVAAARALAGPDAIIGQSTHSLEQASAGMKEADYIGYGPLFATPTKPDYRAIGLSDIGKVEALAAIPVFCIGGIKLRNLPTVLQVGAQRIVIVSELLQSADVAAYTQKIRIALAEQQRRRA